MSARSHSVRWPPPPLMRAPCHQHFIAGFCQVTDDVATLSTITVGAAIAGWCKDQSVKLNTKKLRANSTYTSGPPAPACAPCRIPTACALNRPQERLVEACTGIGAGRAHPKGGAEARSTGSTSRRSARAGRRGAHTPASATSPAPPPLPLTLALARPDPRPSPPLITLASPRPPKPLQVLLNPRHAAARQLAYNTPDDLDELQARRLSASAKKRAAKKRKRSASPEVLCLEK